MSPESASRRAAKGCNCYCLCAQFPDLTFTISASKARLAASSFWHWQVWCKANAESKIFLCYAEPKPTLASHLVCDAKVRKNQIQNNTFPQLFSIIFDYFHLPSSPPASLTVLGASPFRRLGASLGKSIGTLRCKTSVYNYYILYIYYNIYIIYNNLNIEFISPMPLLAHPPNWLRQAMALHLKRPNDAPTRLNAGAPSIGSTTLPLRIFCPLFLWNIIFILYLCIVNNARTRR